MGFTQQACGLGLLLQAPYLFDGLEDGLARCICNLTTQGYSSSNIVHVQRVVPLKEGCSVMYACVHTSHNTPLLEAWPPASMQCCCSVQLLQLPWLPSLRLNKAGPPNMTENGWCRL